MKTIYFIRHSKAEKRDDDDFARDLIEKGESAAKFMGKRLKKHKVMPDIIFASPAKRALKTANLLSKEIGYKKEITQVKALYDCSPAGMHEFIKSIDDELQSVFIVGHNPSITEISEFLSDSDIGNIPTSGIFCIEFDVQSFKEIINHHGHALFFDYPKKHK
ncbi:phosphohistidine phosphatase [Campylobacter iguaniorum]|uniref:SixA phosphatase family protein n=1 Tax=Campylobacter iguaniorum TaxID=1244531 RepID=UPI0007C886B7|nr:histidine phosphatase family protein [Campylobacter iguaniorum]ANE35868.1 phosphohistidine phosphatase [Campylobacter iguaniorum]